MIRKLGIAVLKAAVAYTGALMATGYFASGTAVANSCASACHAAHNQCRIATKGSPSCDAQLTQCLRGCAGKR